MAGVPAADRVVIVGAGPAGMATAIELAQQGVPSVVLEKRGAIASRAPLFAVVPPFADRLAALDPDGSLTKLLTPIDRMASTLLPTGETSAREFATPLAPDPTRSRGDIGAVIRASGPPTAPDADTRRWAFAGIDAVENGLRSLARERYGDLIELRPDSDVTGIRQGDGWAEAVLGPCRSAPAGDAVRGAMLVDASGRDIMGGPRTVHPERVGWIGARFGPPADGRHALTKVRAGDPGGPVHATVALPGGDRTIVWTQVAGDPNEIEPAAARALVQERARSVGVTEALPVDAKAMPVSVQLWTSDEPAVGRVLKVGDSLRAPYFMTSTGAATALVHDAPRAVDTILAVRAGAPVKQAVGAYADAARGANSALLELVRPRLVADAEAIAG
ncbi:MAG: 3-(3-hydroxy-phenyl)propionate hydroxylase [Thermoleophilia bacterium]|nr:3-(3-hydroxy-phenyl)propionate hydroxylase [Thermoleophilia bacterium]